MPVEDSPSKPSTSKQSTEEYDDDVDEYRSPKKAKMDRYRILDNQNYLSTIPYDNKMYAVHGPFIDAILRARVA